MLWPICSAHDYTVPARGKELVKTDLSIAIPPGTYARIAPRSGLAWKHSIDVGAGVRINSLSLIEYYADVLIVVPWTVSCAKNLVSFDALSGESALALFLLNNSIFIREACLWFNVTAQTTTRQSSKHTPVFPLNRFPATGGGWGLPWERRCHLIQFLRQGLWRYAPALVRGQDQLHKAIVISVLFTQPEVLTICGTKPAAIA